jgi:hypothetical protein
MYTRGSNKVATAVSQTIVGLEIGIQGVRMIAALIGNRDTAARTMDSGIRSARCDRSNVSGKLRTLLIHHQVIRIGLKLAGSSYCQYILRHK